MNDGTTATDSPATPATADAPAPPPPADPRDARIAELEAALTAATALTTDQAKKIDDLAVTEALARHDVEMARGDVDGFQKTVTTLNATVASLTGQLESARADAAGARAEAEAARADIARLNDELLTSKGTHNVVDDVLAVFRDLAGSALSGADPIAEALHLVGAIRSSGPAPDQAPLVLARNALQLLHGAVTDIVPGPTRGVIHQRAPLELIQRALGQ